MQTLIFYVLIFPMAFINISLIALSYLAEWGIEKCEAYWDAYDD
jgi:hypothetical protein